MALVVNCWESNTATSGNLAVSKPTSGSAGGDDPKNAAIGDLLLILCGNDEASDTVQFDDTTYKPTGFTFIGTAGDTTADCHCAAFYRVVDGTEGASFTIPPEDNSNDIWGVCILISGSPALDQVGSPVTAGTSGSLAITGVDTSVDGCIAFYVYSYDGGDSSSFALSWTGGAERQELRSDTASGSVSGVWGTKPMASAGASGTATVSPILWDSHAGFQFSIKPGSEAPATSNDLYMAFEA